MNNTHVNLRILVKTCTKSCSRAFYGLSHL